MRISGGKRDRCRGLQRAVCNGFENRVCQEWKIFMNILRKEETYTIDDICDLPDGELFSKKEGRM